MTRYVVVKDLSLGKPVYVAEDEKDAARYLDELEKTLKGREYTRSNSLRLRVDGQSYTSYEVVACPTWEGRLPAEPADDGEPATPDWVEDLVSAYPDVLFGQKEGGRPKLTFRYEGLTQPLLLPKEMTRGRLRRLVTALGGNL